MQVQGEYGNTVEDPKMKWAIFAGGICQFIMYLLLSIVWATWMVNANNID